MGALGLALPRDEDRLDWAESNPDHFESVGMLLFDERVLQALGGTWQRPPDIPDAWADSAAARRFDAAAAAAASEAFPASGPLVWKDPRACLLLRYWQRRIHGPLAAVFVWRDPLAVARSLATRNGFNLFHGVALWEHYNLAALHSLKGMDVLATSYEALVEHPHNIYRKIAAWLDSLEQLAQWRGTWSVERAVATVDTRYLHEAGDSTWPYLESQRQLLDVLGRLDGTHTSFDPGPLPMASPWASGLLDMAGRVTAERALREVYNSRSWKVTRPLRYVTNKTKRGRKGSPASSR
jgi:hypothetical protein